MQIVIDEYIDLSKDISEHVLSPLLLLETLVHSPGDKDSPFPLIIAVVHACCSFAAPVPRSWHLRNRRPQRNHIYSCEAPCIPAH